MANPTGPDEKAFAAVEETLASLPLEMRGPIVKSALRRAGNRVKKRARQNVPPPGYPGDDPSLQPLRDSLRVEVKEYDDAVMAITGPKWPEGAHGHLVEGADRSGGNIDVRHHSHGKPTGVILVKQPFLFNAAKSTQSQQRSDVIDGINKAAEKAQR